MTDAPNDQPTEAEARGHRKITLQKRENAYQNRTTLKIHHVLILEADRPIKILCPSFRFNIELAERLSFPIALVF